MSSPVFCWFARGSTCWQHSDVYRIQLSGINGTPDLQGKVVKVQATLPDHPEVVIPFNWITMRDISPLPGALPLPF